MLGEMYMIGCCVIECDSTGTVTLYMGLGFRKLEILVGEVLIAEVWW